MQSPRLVPSPGWLVDLHCHTSGRSPDGTASPDTVISDAIARGVHAVCLTDHDAFWRPEDVPYPADPPSDQDCASGVGNRGLAVIPGAEINTDDGHVLVFGLTEYRFGFHHSRVLASAVGDAGGAMVLAHPYRRALPPDAEPNTPGYESALARGLDNPLVRLVDAVEVLNGRGTKVENRFARDLARGAGLPGVAGSDAHRKGEAGVVATAFEFPVRNAADLVRHLKTGRFTVVGTGRSAPAREARCQ